MIAILCSAGKDTLGNDRKITIVIDQEGHTHDARVGWPDKFENNFRCGPILRITPEEYIFHLQVATGTGV